MSNCSRPDEGRDQENFLMSSFDFNSTLYFSDDDEKNDIDAFIEIELEARPLGSTEESKEEINDKDEDEDEDLDFRFSFSAVCRKSVSTNVFSFASTTCSADATASAAGSKSATFGIFPSAWKKPAPEVENEEEEEEEEFHSNEDGQTQMINKELLQNRKASKATGGNGVMKVLVKFRATSFRSMLVSVLNLGKLTPPARAKTRQVHGMSEAMARENRGSRKKPFHKLFNGNRSKLSGLVNLEAMRKLFDAVGMRSGNQISRNQAKSCPNSIKSSPMNENRLYSRENSVQAAIAHCKKSLGQTDDFCF